MAIDDVKDKMDSTKKKAGQAMSRMGDDVKGAMGMKKDNKCMDYGLLVIRVALLMFAIHGYSKLTGLDGTTAFFGKLGIPAAGAMALFIGLLEFGGGILMLLGLGTRVIGILLTLNMIVAIALTKLAKPWPPPELELLFLFCSLAIALMGPGKYSLSYMLSKGDPKSPFSKY